MSTDTTTFVTDAALAEMLGISVRTVYRLAKRPGFPGSLRLGRCRRWELSKVLTYLRGGDAAGGQDVNNLYLDLKEK